MDKVAGYSIALMLVLGVAILLSLVGAIPFFFLWNWLMPMLFAAPKLTFLQAWGLFFLISIIGNLFKSYNSTGNSKA